MSAKHESFSRQQLDVLIQSMIGAARIPGAAIAIIAGSETLYARGYGYRDLRAKLLTTAQTAFPIGSTSKAFNAMLLGMLVDERRLDWDEPVQRYLPGFQLRDPLVSSLVTVRDLITMRTGLPRHDWVWTENSLTRCQLVDRLRHLEPSAGYRERFQYNNLTVTAAGHVAEIVAGEAWESLVTRRILEPLAMRSTTLEPPTTDNVTCSYHENSRRELAATIPLAAGVTAPSGGAIYSTVEDMARWVTFNLQGGQADGRRLIARATLQEIHTPQMVVGSDRSGRKPNASYALGWSVDTYNGHARLSHGGYLHDVACEISIFPRSDIGIVSFINFGAPMLALTINEHAFDLIMGQKPSLSLEESLAQYEQRIECTRARRDAVPAAAKTQRSHELPEYAGVYAHPGYGRMQINVAGTNLLLRRGALNLPLRHRHYDVWIAADEDFFGIAQSHPFDCAEGISFETNRDGEVAALSIRLEPAVPAIRFNKERAQP